ncbi:hypothetical protein KEM56_001901, partial [Ascosphaera pollenicola]
MDANVPHAASSSASIHANVPGAPSHSAEIPANAPDAASTSAETSAEVDADEEQCRAQHMLPQIECSLWLARKNALSSFPESSFNGVLNALFADEWSIRPLYNQLTAYIREHNDPPPRSVVDRVFADDGLAPHLSILICHQVLRERRKDKFLQVVNEDDQNNEEDERSEAREAADDLCSVFEDIREFCDDYGIEEPPFHCCMFHDHDDIEDQLDGLEECPFDEMWYRKEWCRKSKFTSNECRRIEEIFKKWRPNPVLPTDSNKQKPGHQQDSSEETLSLPKIWDDGEAARRQVVPPTLPPIRIGVPGHLPLTLPNTQPPAPADGAGVSSGRGREITYNPIRSRQPPLALQPSTSGHGHSPNIDPSLHDACPSVPEAAREFFGGWTFSTGYSRGTEARPHTDSSQDKRRRHGEGAGAATETDGNVSTEPSPKRQRFNLPTGSAVTVPALTENSQAPIGPSGQISISSLINPQPASPSSAAQEENPQAPIVPSGQIPIASLINAQPAGTSSAAQENSQVPTVNAGQSNPGNSSNTQPSNVPPPPPPPPAAPITSAPAPPPNEQQAPTH